MFLADDSLFVREGVRALLAAQPDLEVVGVAEDFDGLVDGATEFAPQVVVTDIRMPPSFQNEGIEAAKLVRKRNPGTGVVVLSQYDEPEYAISLLSEGAAGYAYLLKDRVGDGDQLCRAVREVATGGSMLDPAIVNAIVAPARATDELDEREDQLLQWIAEGRPVKAIAVAWNTTPEAANDAIEDLFLKLAKEASAGAEGALRRLRLLQKAIVDREEQGETLSRLLPGGLAEKMRRDGHETGVSERLDVTVLMSDVRGYSGIAERVDPTVLAGMLNTHRAEMNNAILATGGTVMQYVGDAVMAVFGAPFPQDDHARRALQAACAMHERQADRQRQVARRRAPGVRARHRPVDRRGRGRAARFRRAARVHVGGRHGEPRPAAAGSGAAAGHGAVGRDARGAAGRAGGYVARRGVREGTGDARGRLPADGELGKECGMENVCTVMGVRKTFEAELAPVRALRGVDLDITPGEFVAVMGPSGCGKSTLLNLVAGLDVPDEGTITIDGEEITGRSEDDLARMRRKHIGIVFQFFNLLESMTVLENVVLPAVIAGTKRKPAETRARDMLDLLGLGDKAKEMPGVLSGGQRQRLAIARALANEPTLLLADEPTGALDSAGGHEVLELFKRLHGDGQTIIMVTHNQEVADAADRIVHMRDGRVESDSRADAPPAAAAQVTS